MLKSEHIEKVNTIVNRIYDMICIVSQITESHSRATPQREFQGEEKAQPLIEWLNRELTADTANYAENQAMKAHIAQILDTLAELLAGDPADVGKGHALKAQINQALREAAMVPQVWFPHGTRGGLALDFMPAPGSRYAEPATEMGKTYELIGAFHQILRLVDIWRAGLIGNMRRCKQCGKWLYARFKHKQFCSEACQLADKRTEPYKVNRRNRLRDNYAFKKRQKQNQELEALKQAWPNGQGVPTTGVAEKR
jgi:hypothetical protein